MSAEATGELTAALAVPGAALATALGLVGDHEDDRDHPARVRITLAQCRGGIGIGAAGSGAAPTVRVPTTSERPTGAAHLPSPGMSPISWWSRTRTRSSIAPAGRRCAG